MMLVGLSSSQAVGPGASVPYWLMVRGCSQFLVMCGPFHSAAHNIAADFFPKEGEGQSDRGKWEDRWGRRKKYHVDWAGKVACNRSGICLFKHL